MDRGLKRPNSFFFFIPGMDKLHKTALKHSSVKRVAEMKGRGQERSMKVSSRAEVPEISLRQFCSALSCHCLEYK